MIPASASIKKKLLTNQLFDNGISLGISSQNFDDLNKKIEELTEENKKLAEINQKTIKTTAVFETKLDQLEAELSAVKQKDYKNDLFVTGIPKEANLNTYQLFLKTIALLSLDREITMEQISSVYKIGSDDKTISIIVSLNDEDVKLKILKAAKSKRLNNIFINQRLSFYNSLLLKSINKFKKENHFKYLWIASDGKILLKKDDGSRTIHIKTQTLLKKLSQTAVNGLNFEEADEELLQFLV